MHARARFCCLLALAMLGAALAGEGPVDGQPVGPLDGARGGEPALSARARGYMLFCEGASLAAQGKHEEAIVRFQEVLTLDPESPTLLFEIGYSYYRMGDNGKATDFLKRSLTLDPENGPAHETLAFVHAAATRRAEALTELEAAAKARRRPLNHASLVRRIAWIYERQGDHKKAIEWYQFMLDCGYRSREAYLKLGSLQLQDKRWADGLASFRQVVRRTDSDKASAVEVAKAFADLNDADRNAAIGHIEDAVAKADDPASREVLAMAYQAAGRRRDMLAQLERVAAAGSRRAETQRTFIAEYYEQLGELTKAIAWRTRILDQSPSASAAVRLAALYLKREQVPEAVAAYRKAIELEPKRRDLLRRIADCHTALYQWDQAVAVLGDYLDGERPLQPRHATVAYELGELHRQAGSQDEAAAWKKRAFELLGNAIAKPSPGVRLSDAQLHLLTAELHYADDNPAKALEYLAIARRLDPDDPKKTLLVAAGCKRVQQWAEAAKIYQEFLARDNASLTAAGVYIELATCQEILGDDAAAIVSREKGKRLILQIAAKNPRDEAQAAAQAQLGENALNRNKPAEAIRHLLDAVRRAPAEGLYHLYLAQAYEYLGDWSRATASYSTYLETRDGEPDAAAARTVFRLGVAQARSGQADLGAKSKARAVRLIRDHLQALDAEHRGIPAARADLLRDLASLLHTDKQHDQAIDAIRQAIRLAPEARRTNYRLFLAAIYDDLKRYGDSEKVLLDARKDDPDDDGALNHLAYHYSVRGIKLDEALDLVQRALKTDPLNGAYLDTLGWVYYRQGKHQEALEQIQRALRYEEDAVLRDHLGDAFHKLGKIHEAREAWTKALALDPEIEGVADKLENVKAPPKPEPEAKPQPKTGKPPEPKKPPDNGGEW